MTTPVFLSVGRTSTPEQEEFVRSIEQYLTMNGLIPQTVGRTYIKNQQPLKSVEECMRDCAGTVIVAFERIHIASGVEKRGSPNAQTLVDVNLPTVWNQIEATMAYSLGHPLLVLCEHNLKSEGLLERGYDWYVKWVNLNKTDLNDPEFIGLFADWKRNVEVRQSQQDQKSRKTDDKLDVAELTVGQIVASLKPAQLWALGVALVALLSGVAYVALTTVQKR